MQGVVLAQSSSLCFLLCTWQGCKGMLGATAGCLCKESAGVRQLLGWGLGICGVMGTAQPVDGTGMRTARNGGVTAAGVC
jgi:hypothetical protein